MRPCQQTLKLLGIYYGPYAMLRMAMIRRSAILEQAHSRMSLGHTA